MFSVRHQAWKKNQLKKKKTDIVNNNANGFSFLFFLHLQRNYLGSAMPLMERHHIYHHLDHPPSIGPSIPYSQTPSSSFPGDCTFVTFRHFCYYLFTSSLSMILHLRHLRNLRHLRYLRHIHLSSSPSIIVFFIIIIIIIFFRHLHRDCRRRRRRSSSLRRNPSPSKVGKTVGSHTHTIVGPQTQPPTLISSTFLEFWENETRAGRGGRHLKRHHQNIVLQEDQGRGKTP